MIEVRQGDGVHTEYSGTTLHGLQFTDSRGAEPSTYYSRVGPLASVFDNLRSRTGDARVGVVGLGVGTIAAYARPGDEMTFYEIDQTVVDIARNPAYFTYISGSAVDPRIVVGDARLSLEDQSPGSYDLLVLDAFSSDSVPAHLLTREAIQTYARTLRPGGILAFHLSNRYYDLVGPVAATARSAGFSALSLRSVVDPDPARQFGASDSLWLVELTAIKKASVAGATTASVFGVTALATTMAPRRSTLRTFSAVAGSRALMSRYSAPATAPYGSRRPTAANDSARRRCRSEGRPLRSGRSTSTTSPATIRSGYS